MQTAKLQDFICQIATIISSKQRYVYVKNAIQLLLTSDQEIHWHQKLQQKLTNEWSSY